MIDKNRMHDVNLVEKVNLYVIACELQSVRL